eukprot:sb/3470546/
MNPKEWDEMIAALKDAVASDKDTMEEFSSFGEALVVAEIEITMGDEHIKTIDIKNDILDGGIANLSFVDEERGINLVMGVMETGIMDGLRDTDILQQPKFDLIRFDLTRHHKLEFYINETMTAAARFEAHTTTKTIYMTLMGVILLISISRSLYKSWGVESKSMRSFLAVKRLKDGITLLLGLISSFLSSICPGTVMPLSPS